MIYVVKLKEDEFAENDEEKDYLEFVEAQKHKYFCVCQRQQDVDLYIKQLRLGTKLPPRGSSPFVYIEYSYPEELLRDYLNHDYCKKRGDIVRLLEKITGSRPPLRYEQGKALVLDSGDWWVGNWHQWWLEIEPSLTDEQRRDVWRLFDLNQILQISQVELDETPGFKTMRNEEMEKTIAGNAADLSAWAVYSDWLQQQNDPRGHYIALVLKAINDGLSKKVEMEMQMYEKEYQFQWAYEIILVSLQSAFQLQKIAADVATGNIFDGLDVFGFTIMVDSRIPYTG